MAQVNVKPGKPRWINGRLTKSRMTPAQKRQKRIDKMARLKEKLIEQELLIMGKDQGDYSE